jgi:hypothetical protein
VVNLAILLPNVILQGVQIVMKKKFLRKKRNIIKETRKEIKELKKKKKSLYSKDDSSSFDEDDDSDSDSRRVLFMALETQEETIENNEGDYEEEGEVNLEEELMSFLSALRIAKEKNNSLK